MNKLKKIRAGKYSYRGYIVTCIGYYPPEKRIVWEAEDENGCGFAQSFSLKKTKELIDEEIEKQRGTEN